ncbi:unnamed protein product [Brassicogethes aeneus]|uniref:Uncharacterized protein n=1 Tax=Brassicogethes aeneus TaxID=1431903 RepID=A0A9P0AYQ9_BRAAE|nr:unnamed protein product [Brassicogethes aeneus]
MNDANGVDSLATLKEIVIDNEELKILIPQLGKRIKLKTKLLEHQTVAQTYEEPIDWQLDTESTSESTQSNKILILDLNNQPQPESHDYTVVPVYSSTPSHSRLSSQEDLSSAINECVSNLNLHELLEKSTTGKAIKELYNIKKTLNSKCQSYLVEIIVQHFMNAEPFRRLSNQDFRILSQKIVSEFPNELPQVYFASPIKKRNSREKKSGIARGKLVDKYRNRLTFLREAGILSSSRRPSESNENFLQNVTSDSIDDDDENKKNIIWLRNNQVPWSDVVEKWTSTYEYRQGLLRQEDLDFKDILGLFPIIQNPLGHHLIDFDFKKKYPKQYQALYNNFEIVFSKLLQLKKKNLNQSDTLLVEIIKSENIDVESRHYLMLSLLAALLPTRTYNKKAKNTWYPTSTETVSGIVVQIKIPGDIENIIAEKRKKLEKYGLPLLPFIIIEGISYTNINNIYVSYNNILYHVVSVLKAVDVCFELIHTFNLKYPYECEHVWMFIQLGMYNIKTMYDKIPNILDIVNKISSSD